MVAYKEQMKSSIFSLTHLSTFYWYIRNVELHLSFENSILFISVFLKHGLIFMFLLSNNLYIHSVILWWIYADQFYIQGNSFCSSKLSILLGSRKNLIEFNCTFHARNTCLPKWCVCHHELFSGCWRWESESIPQSGVWRILLIRNIPQKLNLVVKFSIMTKNHCFTLLLSGIFKFILYVQGSEKSSRKDMYENFLINHWHWNIYSWEHIYQNPDLSVNW